MECLDVDVSFQVRTGLSRRTTRTACAVPCLSQVKVCLSKTQNSNSAFRQAQTRVIILLGMDRGGEFLHVF